ncbi:sigma-70 family RNA polymerase sigma factor [Ornithinibacillus massiliensis]|uniref:Sigma-70 family RNA polymerase sigma factor n=1 Tax=Ornithinibacillus massiliensis TaxID=1944633 RepID=A0ABS5MAK6_9BACI|nr:sigma-70 family RNA polymerase sigma factor [Ornithinibacillus massiliensis]MBS3678977.1 sigma-70 family RNA polymerase sigma factor [Ornithinibacillus massiliensis]
MNGLERAFSIEDTVEDREQIIDDLMHHHGDDILHLVYTYVKDRTIAEDLTQEIFIKCYEKLDQFKQQSSIKTWAFRVASNHCKDYLRSWHYRKVILNEKVLDYIPSKSKQVEDVVITKSEDNRLANAVMSIPVKYREVVFLHYYKELSLAEISTITGVNINTLKTRLKRAKELLKKKMEELS